MQVPAGLRLYGGLHSSLHYGPPDRTHETGLEGERTTAEPPNPPLHADSGHKRLDSTCGLDQSACKICRAFSGSALMLADPKYSCMSTTSFLSRATQPTILHCPNSSADGYLFLALLRSPSATASQMAFVCTQKQHCQPPGFKMCDGKNPNADHNCMVCTPHWVQHSCSSCGNSSLLCTHACAQLPGAIQCMSPCNSALCAGTTCCCNMHAIEFVGHLAGDAAPSKATHPLMCHLAEYVGHVGHLQVTFRPQELGQGKILVCSSLDCLALCLGDYLVLHPRPSVPAVVSAWACPVVLCLVVPDMSQPVLCCGSAQNVFHLCFTQSALAHVSHRVPLKDRHECRAAKDTAWTASMLANHVSSSAGCNICLKPWCLPLLWPTVIKSMSV